VPVGLAAPLFAVSAALSLATSWLVVSRLERLGERLALSEALLGLLAALAADSPEITAAVTALVNRQGRVGVGVVLGSNVFNLAALIALGAVVAGRIPLRRRVVLLGGAVAAWESVVALLTVLGGLAPGPALGLAALVLVAYATLLGLDRRGLRRLAGRSRVAHWLRAAVIEEERELEAAIRPPRGRRVDALAALGAVLVVVLASAAMERTGSALGRALGVPDAVIGGLVLAAVTSLPNSVTAVYLARRGRGAAVLSTTLNSNSLNIAAGLLLPATLTGLGAASPASIAVAAWAAGLTGLTLGLAYFHRGLSRRAGVGVIAAYAVFVAVLVTLAYRG
jgi:cation:H+ antiporter